MADQTHSAGGLVKVVPAVISHPERLRATISRAGFQPELGGKGSGLLCEEVHMNASFQFHFCSTSGTKWNCNVFKQPCWTGHDNTDSTDSKERKKKHTGCFNQFSNFSMEIAKV